MPHVLSHVDGNHGDEEAECDENEDSGGKNLLQAGAPSQQAGRLYPVPKVQGGQ